MNIKPTVDYYTATRQKMQELTEERDLYKNTCYQMYRDMQFFMMVTFASCCMIGLCLLYQYWFS